MKKLLVFVVMVTGYTLSSDAHPITITTSCGEIKIVESSDFANMTQLLEKVNEIEADLCGGTDIEDDEQPTDPIEKP